MDTMLEELTAMQYQEWMAFFKIRDGRGKELGKNPAEQQRMAADLKATMLAFQSRRDRKKTGMH